MAEKKHHAIKVSTQVNYIEAQSNPSANEFVFAYTVTITNIGSVPAQLISRHWVITDSNHERKEVKGLGVIGQQPLLAPNESFEYTSGTMIPTHHGEMHGSYHFVTEDAVWFEVPIDTFLLISDRVLH